MHKRIASNICDKRIAKVKEMKEAGETNATEKDSRYNYVRSQRTRP